MSKRFNLFPREPQKSYYSEGERDSTANSLFQLRETNRQTANQYQLIKDSGKMYWSGPWGGVPVAAPGGWQPAAYQPNTKKNSNPQLYKRIGSSKTYNNGTGGRLQRLKTTAIAKANNTIQNRIKTPVIEYHEFNITGGTKTQVGNYTVHTFTTSDNFIIPAGLLTGTFEYLVVGGGAGGASSSNNTQAASGGGGAGGEVLENGTPLGPDTYVITVGIGGGGGPLGGPAIAGGESTIVDSGAANIATAKGGESTLANSIDNGSNGGNNQTAGFSGGAGVASASGGGASWTANGEDAAPGPAGGDGGAGTSSSISGLSVGYGGGGGGGSGSFNAGGTGHDGGGQGAEILNIGGDATAPGGGGGGSSSLQPGGAAGGSGFDGIIIIRYLSTF